MKQKFTNEYYENYRKVRQARGWKSVTFFLPGDGADALKELYSQWKASHASLFKVKE